MPCNSLAVIAIMLAVAQLEALRNSADAMRSLKDFLEDLFKTRIEPKLYGQPPNHSVLFELPRGYSYVQIDKQGLRLAGDFTADQRKKIEAFVQQLLRAMAEQEMVDAIAEQLELLSDEPALDEWGQNVVGRVLTLKV